MARQLDIVSRTGSRLADRLVAVYLLLLNYPESLEAVDAALPRHVRWLEQRYADGDFLVTGRREPRTGGVILARGMARERVESIIATDPFVLDDLVTYEVIEFVPSKTGPELAAHLVA